MPAYKTAPWVRRPHLEVIQGGAAEPFTTDRTIALIKKHFGEWFDGKTPIPEAREHVIYYLAEIAKIADERSKLNPDGSGPLGLWDSADVQGYWKTAKERYRSQVAPIFQAWLDAGSPNLGWGKGPFMTPDQAALFWSETERLALSINQVFGSETDADITWQIYKGTVKDTIKNLAPTMIDWAKTLAIIVGAVLLLLGISKGKE